MSARRLAIAALLALAACSTPPPPPPPPVQPAPVAAPEPEPVAQNCWRYASEDKTFGYSSTLCTTGDKATLWTYYPNMGDAPTTCRSDGTLLKDANSALAVALEPGTCENGRNSAAHTVRCKSAADGALECSNDGTKRLMVYRRQ